MKLKTILLEDSTGLLKREYMCFRFPGQKAKAFSIALRFSNNIFGAHAWMHLANRMNLNRPRKQGKGWRVKVDQEEVTAMPAAH